MIKTIAILLILIACKKDIKPREFVSPLENSRMWVYSIKGFRGMYYYDNYRPPPGSVDTNRYINNKKYDELDPDSTYIDTLKILSYKNNYALTNFYLYNFWGYKLKFDPAGYYSFSYDDSEDKSYLLKFPIEINKNWKNKYGVVGETCTITSLNKTIGTYENCIEITVNRYNEGFKTNFKYYLKSGVGLVYLKNHEAEDEIKLIDHIKR